MALSTRVLLVVGVLALAAGFATADEFESPNVVHLTSKNYDDKVNDGKVYFIKYYAPWCGHCKRLATTWKDLGAAFKGEHKVAVGHVDCTVSRDVCQTADVKGYPTLKVIYKGEEYKGYRGPRELKALKAFLKEVSDELLQSI